MRFVLPTDITWLAGWGSKGTHLALACDDISNLLCECGCSDVCSAHALLKCMGTAMGFGTGPATGRRERNRDDAKTFVRELHLGREGHNML